MSPESLVLMNRESRAGDFSRRPAAEVEICRATSVIESARSLVIFTGAGMSAESGVPTFRGEGGLWQGYRPEELATPAAFEKSPEVVRSWYLWRRELIAKVEPHRGHRALAHWCLHSAKKSRVITQNVDGLHQRSGCPDVVELHGSILHDRCHRCGQRSPDLREVMCDCGGAFRPAVVWFGEALPESAIIESLEEIDVCDVMVVIGTSAVVHPAAGMVFRALEIGANVIEVNPQPVLPEPVLHLCGTAKEILPRIFGTDAADEEDSG